MSLKSTGILLTIFTKSKIKGIVCEEEIFPAIGKSGDFTGPNQGGVNKHLLISSEIV